ncbi:hypothetical protein TNCV_2494011 [Trichonephila clavipes]|uniref:Uncharacterized protein n=1 Tax=Trichonephila clavipes TaxID=2585209 RepID=A0A8X6RRZ9_TRICX|nr:hypothetical protein TNCV_2494011 [Trichonephila clavipes]
MTENWVTGIETLRSTDVTNSTPYRQARFVVDHTFEDAPVCDAASRVAEAMVSKLRVHAAANVVKLFVQTLAVLQTLVILDSGLVVLKHDPLRP